MSDEQPQEIEAELVEKPDEKNEVDDLLSKVGESIKKEPMPPRVNDSGVSYALINAARENGKKGGRPVGSANWRKSLQVEIRNEVIDALRDDLVPIVAGVKDLCHGLYYEKELESGIVRIYKERPNATMLMYVLDHLIGKAPQSIDVNVDNQSAVQNIIALILNQNASNDEGTRKIERIDPKDDKSTGVQPAKKDT